MGVFEPRPENEEEPTDFDDLEPRQRISRYIGWHLRRQLSIGENHTWLRTGIATYLVLADIWWLVWGVFFIAIIERHNILDENQPWFDLFRVLFELVSAFGGIGLSLGIPTVWSLSYSSVFFMLIYRLRRTIPSSVR